MALPEVCMFEILALPESTLKAALPKAPARVLAKLANAYPRAAGRAFIEILSQSLRKPTLQFLHEEMISHPLPPTWNEIRQAEAELLKILKDQERALAVPSVPIHQAA
jgi:hypothetical protein